jgi:hypothetical protein
MVIVLVFIQYVCVSDGWIVCHGVQNSVLLCKGVLIFDTLSKQDYKCSQIACQHINNEAQTEGSQQ